MSAAMVEPTHEPHPFEHVMDSPETHHKWEFFNAAFGPPVEWSLPVLQIPYLNSHGQLDWYNFQVTKFMILELLAAVLIIVIYVPLARRAQNGNLPKGVGGTLLSRC